jgi:hypothetical protein
MIELHKIHPDFSTKFENDNMDELILKQKTVKTFVIGFLGELVLVCLFIISIYALSKFKGFSGILPFILFLFSASSIMALGPWLFKPRGTAAFHLIRNLVKIGDEQSVKSIIYLLCLVPEAIYGKNEEKIVTNWLVGIGNGSIKSLMEILSSVMSDDAESGPCRKITSKMGSRSDNWSLLTISLDVIEKLNYSPAVPILQSKLWGDFNWSIEDKIVKVLRSLNQKYLETDLIKLSDGITKDINNLLVDWPVTIKFSYPIDGREIKSCPFKITLIKYPVKSPFHAHLDFQRTLLNRLRFHARTDRKHFLKKLFCVADPSNLDLNIWTIQKGWSVGTLLTVTYEITHLMFDSKTPNNESIRIEPIKILDDINALRAIFFYRRDGREFFDGWNVVKTGENEYFFKGVV